MLDVLESSFIFNLLFDLLSLVDFLVDVLLAFREVMLDVVFRLGVTAVLGVTVLLRNTRSRVIAKGVILNCRFTSSSFLLRALATSAASSRALFQCASIPAFLNRLSTTKRRCSEA